MYLPIQNSTLNLVLGVILSCETWSLEPEAYNDEVGKPFYIVTSLTTFLNYLFHTHPSKIKIKQYIFIFYQLLR